MPLRGVDPRMVNLAGELVAADLMRTPFSAEQLDVVADYLATAVLPPLVYGSFDGDHMEILPNLSDCIYAAGKVPVNVEAVVNYGVVTEYATRRPSRGSEKGAIKRRVLEVDLCLLDRCDEQWVLTDAEPAPAGAAEGLAEGVLAEMAYYLAKHPGPQRVQFVTLAQAFSGRKPNAKHNLTLDFNQFKELLPEDIRLLLDFAAYRPDMPLIYLNFDRGMAMHADHAQEWGYEHDALTIRPDIVFPYRRGKSRHGRFYPTGEAIVARAALLRRCDRMWQLPGQSEPPGLLYRLFEKIWQALKDTDPELVTVEEVGPLVNEDLSIGGAAYNPITTLTAHASKL